MTVVSRAEGWALWGALVVVVVAGCASVPEGAPPDVVKARAQQRWDAVVRGDFKTAYQFLSPGLREIQGAESYAETLKKGFWKSATVEKVECAEPDLCAADIRVTYEFQGRPITSPVRESWGRIQDQWWYLQK